MDRVGFSVHLQRDDICCHFGPAVHPGKKVIDVFWLRDLEWARRTSEEITVGPGYSGCHSGTGSANFQAELCNSLGRCQLPRDRSETIYKPLLVSILRALSANSC